MSVISIQAEGRRLYFCGNTYAAKDKIKAIGGHWDADRRQWWVGSQARTEAEALATAATADQAIRPYTPTPITHDSRAYRKVRYTGKSGAARTYYVVAESQSGRYRLTSLDRKIDFWAEAAACETVKVYAGRERFAGYRSGNVTVYPTIGSIADFVAESRAAEKQIAQGEIPDGYDRDLEDGGVKRISECDMPASEMGGAR